MSTIIITSPDFAWCKKIWHIIVNPLSHGSRHVLQLNLDTDFNFYKPHGPLPPSQPTQFIIFPFEISVPQLSDFPLKLVLLRLIVIFPPLLSLSLSFINKSSTGERELSSRWIIKTRQVVFGRKSLNNFSPAAACCSGCIHTTTVCTRAGELFTYI